MGSLHEARLAQMSWRLDYLRREIVRSLGHQAVAGDDAERARHAAEEDVLRQMAARAEEALRSARRGLPPGLQGL